MKSSDVDAIGFDFHKVKNIYGRGSLDERGNSKGYHNKKAAFSLLQKRLAESHALPVLALVYANDKYLTLCHPQRDTAMQNMLEKVIQYYQSLSMMGACKKSSPTSRFCRPLCTLTAVVDLKEHQMRRLVRTGERRRPRQGRTSLQGMSGRPWSSCIPQAHCRGIATRSRVPTAHECLLWSKQASTINGRSRMLGVMDLEAV